MKNMLLILKVLSLLISGINTFAHTPSKEWFQTNAVLRVSLGNFLFFATFAALMIGVKDQNDKRDSWHHGGWVLKIVVWVVLVALMFFLPNIVITIYGKRHLLLFIWFLFP
jgi:serine incorporator 1/3